MITETIKNFSEQKIIASLLILTLISILARLYFLPFEIPFKTDAIDYFSFAFEVSKTHQYPVGIQTTNDGWPLFLSPIFSIIGQSDMMTLINAQRISSVIISSLTIIPIFYLCRKFVLSKYALVGAALFGFSYKLMENSILGLTESLFVFLVTMVLLFSMSKNTKLYMLSFVFLALSSIVRYESLLFLVPLCIIFILKFHKQNLSYLKLPLLIFIFILILLPISVLRLESNDIDGFTSHVFGGITNPAKYESVLEDKPSESKTNFIENSFSNTLKFLGIILIPFFIFFIPFGIYNLIKTKNINLLHLLIFSVFMILPAMYAYGREIQDTRYLYVLFPIFCVFSAYGFDVTQKLQKPKILVLIISIIIFSSIILLYYEQPDYVYSNEILQVTKELVKNENGVNNYPGNSYVKIATLEQNWPNSLPIGQDGRISFFIKKIPSQNYNSLEEYISNSQNFGLTHIVVTENNRSTFLDELLNNHEKYSYLEKIFDSKNHNFQNKIIILKINYVEFENKIKMN